MNLEEWKDLVLGLHPTARFITDNEGLTRAEVKTGLVGTYTADGRVWFTGKAPQPGSAQEVTAEA